MRCFPTRSNLILPLMLAGGFLMAGCEATVQAELDVSDIRERNTTGLFATSKVSTGDCDRGIGASEREGTLGWTSWVLAGVFPDTRFRGCYEDDDGATATFLNMFVFDAFPEKTLQGQSHVNLKLYDGVLYVVLPDYVQSNIRRVRDQTGVESGPDVSGVLALLNSSAEPFIYRMATYDEAGPSGWSEPRELDGAARVAIDLSTELGKHVLRGERAPLLKIESPD